MLGKILPAGRGDLFRHGECQTLGCTLGHTGRLQSLINAILAEITLVNLAGMGLPLGNAPGACGDTRLTTDTQTFLNKDDTILVPFLHGTGWTCIHTPRLFAVKAGHIDKVDTWNLALCCLDRDHFTEKGSFAVIILVLTMHLTGLSTNTIRYILGYDIFAHPYSSGL